MTPSATSAAFKVYTNSQEAVATPALKGGGDPKDRELATRVLKSLNELQEAMDAAALAGLIVEPAFKKFGNRFKELGTDADSWVAHVEIYRKLA